MKTFDLIVIGSGAGLNVATGAAEEGLKVAIIEDSAMGGTCLNRGCIPSKIVIHSAEVAEMIHRASEFGISAKVNKVNFKQVTDRASHTVDADARSIERNVRADKNPILFKGRGKFVDKFVVEVNGERIKGKKIVIAAGARPSIPPIPGLDKVPYMTSTEALRQTSLPKSMIIIGGGYIAVELGFFYAELGTKMTILQRNEVLIPREDKEIAGLITELWKKKHTVFTSADVVKVEKQGKEVAVTVKVGNATKKIIAEKLLVATGVKPNSDTLQLGKTGVKINDKGFISVNRFMETNVKNIWALGDIAGIYLFRHSANLEAEFVLENLLGTKRAVDYYPMPHSIFTSPQIAGVGLTEQEAQEQKKNYVIGRSYYKDTGKGFALAEKHGFVKLIVDRKSKEILGCHIIGPEASVLLHEVLIAMKAGKNKALDLLRDTVHVHPSLNEVVQRAALNVPL
ncbi:MAG TPA: dihydrolipoyl dehydrogenase [Candidatus Nanoarchaeia archaeon]|nr:dihydrolipoyl dehydrogenase [Candidatus Nanoarchaeia archaeon]